MVFAVMAKVALPGHHFKIDGSCKTSGANTIQIEFSTQAWKPLLDLINLYPIIVAFLYFLPLYLSQKLKYNEIPLLFLKFGNHHWKS